MKLRRIVQQKRHYPDEGTMGINPPSANMKMNVRGVWSNLGEWQPIKNPKAEIKKLREYAKNTLQKDKRINIRISSKDLDQVQVIAAQEGIPYQTLISSIIHKYVSGYLIERKKA
jgi:predicted DNA binding CopG/RHH family protein